MNSLAGNGTTTAVVPTADLAEPLLRLKGRDYQEVVTRIRDCLKPSADLVKDEKVTVVESLE
jgi:hypothetical protein